LTSITEPEDFILKHIVDSLIMLSKDYVKEGIKVLDLGTGGGFPGIPLKILYPEIQITLVDSVGKKLKFIDDAARNLGIKVELVHERAEILGKNKKYREKYDIVISRAVANMQTLSELCLPLVKVDGLMIASKGPKYNEELDAAKNAMKILGGQVKSIEDCTIPIAELERHVIIIEKTNATPAAYPRKPGMPNKNPL
jgi:16S rRNA (guanine527-N7)-methyltransferase